MAIAQPPSAKPERGPGPGSSPWGRRYSLVVRRVAEMAPEGSDTRPMVAVDCDEVGISSPGSEPFFVNRTAQEASVSEEGVVDGAKDHHGGEANA